MLRLLLLVGITLLSSGSAIPIQSSCVDSATHIFENDDALEVGCSWLTDNPIEEANRVAEYCPRPNVKYMCADTCDTCEDECEDNPVYIFRQLILNVFRRCSWVTEVPSQIDIRREGYCDNIGIFCPDACGYCPEAEISSSPSSQPSMTESDQPSASPSIEPSMNPSDVASSSPTSQPSESPSSTPSSVPSDEPSANPTSIPSSVPSTTPSILPTDQPSTHPSLAPSGQPTSAPSFMPSSLPTNQPSDDPSLKPSSAPTDQPSVNPTAMPSLDPSKEPSSEPSFQPTLNPSSMPSLNPTSKPSETPSLSPSAAPTSEPSMNPTTMPSFKPSKEPSANPTGQPSSNPSLTPSSAPTSQPSVNPTTMDSSAPTDLPSSIPSSQPSSAPTDLPSSDPSFSPSSMPTMQPSLEPTTMPSFAPSIEPTSTPSSVPSFTPQNCDDSPLMFWEGVEDQITCADFDLNKCDEPYFASHCPATCGKCYEQEYKCADSEAIFVHEDKLLYCEWLSDLDQSLIDQRCADDDIKLTCRSTCGYCGNFLINFDDVSLSDPPYYDEYKNEIMYMENLGAFHGEDFQSMFPEFPGISKSVVSGENSGAIYYPGDIALMVCPEGTFDMISLHVNSITGVATSVEIVAYDELYEFVDEAVILLTDDETSSVSLPSSFENIRAVSISNGDEVAIGLEDIDLFINSPCFIEMGVVSVAAMDFIGSFASSPDPDGEPKTFLGFDYDSGGDDQVGIEDDQVGIFF